VVVSSFKCAVPFRI